MPQTVKAPTGVSIWNAMREEFILNLYPLPYTTLPPTIFYVYLHPGDFDRIEGIVPRLVAELQQALSDEVRAINQGREKSGKPGRLLSRLLAREEAPPIEVPPGGWEVHINADRNGTLKPGHLGLDSMLPLPAPLEFGGPATTRIVKSVLTETGRISTTIESHPLSPSASGSASASASVAAPGADLRERATLTYDDEQGHHTFSIRKDTLSVGRGGSAVWIDVQLITSSKVSREHFRLRRDASSGQFFIQDLSNWGTSVDGVTIPAAVKGPDGVLRPGTEYLLGATARIDLAGALVVQFETRPLA
jgi:pSer/pThr/pTyr-binding forkhead associated (FHA) protein